MSILTHINITIAMEDLEKKETTVKPGKHKPCKFFNKEGGCKKGDQCEFSHIMKIKKFVPRCKFYAKGECKNGNACVFRHVIKVNKKPCSFFAAGSCKKGDKCDFKHNITPTTSLSSTPTLNHNNE